MKQFPAAKTEGADEYASSGETAKVFGLSLSKKAKMSNFGRASKCRPVCVLLRGGIEHCTAELVAHYTGAEPS